MSKTSEGGIQESTNLGYDFPGLLSFVNAEGKWSYLTSEWLNYIDADTITNYQEKQSLIHPDDLGKYSNDLQSAFEKRSKYVIDFRLRNKEGEYIMIREYGKPVNKVNGEFSGFSFTGTDVSDIKVDECEKLKLEFFVKNILEHSSDMIAIYDPELRLVNLNKRAEIITGLDLKKDKGKLYADLFPDAVKSQGYRDLVTALKGENVHNTRFDSSILHRTFENFLLPLKDSENNIQLVFTIAHDFTEYLNTTIELEKAYRVLEEKNRELVTSNKELGSFTYVASHDLQEPLRKIQAFGKRLVEKESANLSETGHDYLTRMVDASNRMQKLIDSLLEFSRTSTAVKNFENSDLNILIEEVKRENRYSIEEKQAVIEVGPLPTVSVIPFQFKQLMSNLISNSLKYARNGVTPVIRIESDIVASKTINRADILTGINFCRIKFSDNGIGFEQTYADQIFELFQRLHGKAEYTGSGIGLSICKKIAENHQGFIVAEGRPDEGATFYIYLPMKHS